MIAVFRKCVSAESWAGKEEEAVYGGDECVYMLGTRACTVPVEGLYRTCSALKPYLIFVSWFLFSIAFPCHLHSLNHRQHLNSRTRPYIVASPCPFQPSAASELTTRTPCSVFRPSHRCRSAISCLQTTQVGQFLPRRTKIYDLLLSPFTNVYELGLLAFCDSLRPRISRRSQIQVASPE